MATSHAVANLITHALNNPRSAAAASLRRTLHNLVDNMIERGNVEEIKTTLVDNLGGKDTVECLLSHLNSQEMATAIALASRR